MDMLEIGMFLVFNFEKSTILLVNDVVCRFRHLKVCIYRFIIAMETS